MEVTERRHRSLRAGHYKFILGVHVICCIGFFVIGCLSLIHRTKMSDDISIHIIANPTVWAFFLSLKSFSLAVTDLVIATKGDKCVRDEVENVVCLSKFQVVVCVVTLPVYPWGVFMSMLHFFFYQKELVFDVIIYYISFIASVFVTFNCCFVSTYCCGNLHDNDAPRGGEIIRLPEVVYDSSAVGQASLLDAPPEYSPRVEMPTEIPTGQNNTGATTW